MSQRRTSEEKVASLDERIAQLLAQKEEEQARLDAEAEKARHRTECVIGRLVLEQVEGGWRMVDLTRLANVIAGSGEVLGRCVTGELSVSETAKRTREFERTHRVAQGARP